VTASHSIPLGTNLLPSDVIPDLERRLTDEVTFERVGGRNHVALRKFTSL
jgi:hypothetical protein